MSIPLPFRNVAGSLIPGFAVMRCTGTSIRAGQLILDMNQPHDGLERLYYVNGPVAVGSQHYGECHLLTDASSGLHPVRVTTDQTPQPGASWGAKSGQWQLYPQRYGFTILGTPQSGRVFARQHELSIVEGTIATDLRSGETSVLRIYSTSGSERMNIDVRDRMLAIDHHLPAETSVIAAWLDGQWCVVSASRCPVLNAYITS